MASSPKKVAAVPAVAESSQPSTNVSSSDGHSELGDRLRSSVRAGADAVARSWHGKHGAWLKLTTWAAAIGQAAEMEKPSSKSGQSDD